MISVLVLTLNEESNLPRCLDSIRWCDDIVVLDSGSTDRTVEIATRAGARVITRAFDDWAGHQNWAVKNIRFRHPWVYYSDADEVITTELRDELLGIARDTLRREVAYRLRYKNFYRGRWIRHCGIYPVWVLRFFQPSRVRWERTVNPVAVVDGPEGRLESHFEHYSFEKGMDAWWEKHRKYADQEANETILSLSTGSIPWRSLFVGDAVARRRALKELSFRLPFRPLLRFLYMYVVRLGFLDGLEGLSYCRLLAQYERMIVRRVRELRARSPAKGR